MVSSSACHSLRELPMDLTQSTIVFPLLLIARVEAAP
jgi:hypothetical protein